MTKTAMLAIMTAFALMTLAACSRHDTQNSAAEPPPLPVEAAQPATAPLVGDESSFLEKAHSLGYTDKQLESLEADGFPQDRILDLSGALPDGNTTPNGRYVLSWYEVDFIRSCWFLFDAETNRATVLPDWENGYAQFEFLDDESFYGKLNDADYVRGVRFYKVGNPHEPYASWNPGDSGAANEKNKSLLYVYKLADDKMLLAFWCETPKEWDGRVEGATETYKITLLNHDGDIVNETDTGIVLGQSKTGIAAPSFERANMGRAPIPGIVYFDIGEISYEYHYKSGAVAVI